MKVLDTHQDNTVNVLVHDDYDTVWPNLDRANLKLHDYESLSEWLHETALGALQTGEKLRQTSVYWKRQFNRQKQSTKLWKTFALKTKGRALQLADASTKDTLARDWETLMTAESKLESVQQKQSLSC